MKTPAIKNGLGVAARFLNHPSIKEGIKNIASFTAFTFGMFEAYDVYQILRGREISTEINANESRWIQLAAKVVLLCAKVSLILSATVSRPGVFLISIIMGCIFSTEQLHRAFGPNAIFKLNPQHPRHIFSIVAVILALPSVVHSIQKCLCWTYTKVCKKGRSISIESTTRPKSWLTDTKVRLLTLFNIATSRPMQHFIANRLL